MIEVGIPVYNAVDCLPKALESLVNQTYSDFSVCLSLDGDTEYYDDYQNIINIFKERGLSIRVLLSDINQGPGLARQKILDTTKADFITFLDADDLFMPRAIEVLYKVISMNAEKNNKDFADIVRSAYIHEKKGELGVLIPHNSASITHFHGKMYRVGYLKEKDIHFLSDLKANEDAYFNLIAWNSTKKRNELPETTYIWRDNKNSLTRYNGEKNFFVNSYVDYIKSQVEGLKKIFQINEQVSSKLITATLQLIYSNYMRACFYQLSLEECDKIILTLKEVSPLQLYLCKYESWVELINVLKVGEIYEGTVVFYKELFNEWAERLLKAEDIPNG